eukprot:TRINITY_DN2043_c0_g1_i1.p1 TRINITY_DN2043_c0_g1~~TRINITY_DN2043_c0_g1_i1.p1  ORF type:complete len:165 (+),score=38.98 TRINITY_DN2043_c0_g1_i1:53-547(+)
MSRLVMLPLLLSLVEQVVGHHDDDGLCWDKSKSKAVKTGDCVHGCCVDNNCGSESECDAKHVIGIIIGVAAAVCCCIFIILAILWWRKEACFKNRDQPSDQAPTVGTVYNPNAPTNVYPDQQQQYPQQYPQAYAQPPPQGYNDPNQPPMAQPLPPLSVAPSKQV